MHVQMVECFDILGFVIGWLGGPRWSRLVRVQTDSTYSTHPNIISRVPPDTHVEIEFILSNTV